MYASGPALFTATPSARKEGQERSKGSFHDLITVYTSHCAPNESLQAVVDELLLEILEQMPQTVMGFKGEMKDCSAIFEPECVIFNYRGCQVCGSRGSSFWREW